MQSFRRKLQVNLDEKENTMEVDEMEKMELDEPNLNIDIKCSKCMKTFETEEELFNHAIQKHTMAEFICHLCVKQYNSSNQLNEHIEIYHDNDKDQDRQQNIDDGATSNELINCQKCSIPFKTKDELKAHEDEEHTDDTYGCTPCEMTFIT